MQQHLKEATEGGGETRGAPGSPAVAVRRGKLCLQPELGQVFWGRAPCQRGWMLPGDAEEMREGAGPRGPSTPGPHACPEPTRVRTAPPCAAPRVQPPTPPGKAGPGAAPLPPQEPRSAAPPPGKGLSGRKGGRAAGMPAEPTAGALPRGHPPPHSPPAARPRARPLLPPPGAAARPGAAGRRVRQSLI